MALASISLRFKFPPLQSSSSAFINTLITPRKPTSIACSKPSRANDSKEEGSKPRKLSEQSSWEVKDSEGKDYLYRLGAEADNLNIAVGARAGIIDDVFIGDFLGKDSDIVFDYRQKATRSFEHLQGDYYIAPSFLDKVAVHIVKNYLAPSLNIKIPLILGIWGGKGQGKTFQTELIFKTMGVEPVIMSAGELESDRAGEPGRLIRDRYRTASQVIQNQGKMSVLMINDIDAGLGRFGETQMTVNNQIVVGTLMNLADNPTRVSVGQDWREADIVNRVPMIVTGNDFSTLYAPLIREGRMEKFYWQPTREDIVNIVTRMYEKDGISRKDVITIVDTFPNQALDFYGALRSRTYDRSILKWVDEAGGMKTLGKTLLRRKKTEEVPQFTPPEQTVEALMESGYLLIKEQKLVMETKLSKDGDKEMVQGKQTYGYIKESQLRWLEDTSKQAHNQRIRGKSPALAFFHIPILEVRDLWYTPVIGQFQEGVACSIVQSGVLKTFMSMGNVKAAFIGHDHVNDFCGNLKGVWFCYGGGFGYHAYGRPNWYRRARVIEAKLGKGRDKWTGVDLIKTWKRLDDEDLNKIDEQILWETSETFLK